MSMDAGEDVTTVSRITDIDGTFYDLNRRILVEYRTVSNAELKGFAVAFTGRKYGCSKNGGVSANGVSLINQNLMIGSLGDKFSYYKLNPSTFLQLTISQQTGKQDVALSYSMDNYTTLTTTFNYEAIGHSKLNPSFNLKTTNFSTYSNGKFQLPIPTSNIIGNAPTFTVTGADNIKVLHNRKFTVDLMINATDYSINRIFAIDVDTFIAVLRKPNSPEAYVRLWTAWKGEDLIVQNVSSVVVLPEGNVIFKSFKIGNDHFCLVTKGTIPTAKKLSVICYQDMYNGEISLQSTVITNTLEVSDINFMEGSRRVDILMVGTPSDSQKPELTHTYMELDNNNRISTTTLQTNNRLTYSDPQVIRDSYIVTDAMFDFWGDNESSNHITLKLVGAGLDPIVAKYRMIFDQNTPRISYLYSMRMESKDLSFCASKNEMVFYSPKTRRIMGQRWESRTSAGVPENKLYYPLNDYGITYVQHFNCIPEKGIFQILGINSDGKKQIVTFRGGESTRAGRRVHSITPVEDSVTFIESGFNFDYVVTIASFPGLVTEKRSFIVTYPEGPIF